MTKPVRAIYSTADGRLTAGRIYTAEVVFKTTWGRTGPGWRFRLTDDRGEVMTFNMDAFREVTPPTWRDEPSDYE